MKKQLQINEFPKNSRTFTFHQLSKISDENYGVLNQNIDMSRFQPEDVFVLTPIMIHEHAFGEPVNPHLRTIVSIAGNQTGLALQDVTIEQWETGSEIPDVTSLPEDSDLPF